VQPHESGRGGLSRGITKEKKKNLRLEDGNNVKEEKSFPGSSGSAIQQLQHYERGGGDPCKSNKKLDCKGGRVVQEGTLGGGRDRGKAGVSPEEEEEKDAKTSEDPQRKEKNSDG